MALNIDSFRRNFKGQGFRTNLFEVFGNFPTFINGTPKTGDPGREIRFLCRSASLPGMNLGIVEVPFRGRTIKLPGDRTFEDWTITVLMPNFNIRNSFEAWSNYCNGIRTNFSQQDQNADETAGNTMLQDWQVYAMGRDGRSLAEYQLRGCFPSSIGALDLNADATTTVGEFTATITYTYFTRGGALGEDREIFGNTNPVGAAGSDIIPDGQFIGEA